MKKVLRVVLYVAVACSIAAAGYGTVKSKEKFPKTSSNQKAGAKVFDYTNDYTNIDVNLLCNCNFQISGMDVNNDPVTEFAQHFPTLPCKPATFATLQGYVGTIDITVQGYIADGGDHYLFVTDSGGTTYSLHVTGDGIYSTQVWLNPSQNVKVYGS